MECVVVVVVLRLSCSSSWLFPKIGSNGTGIELLIRVWNHDWDPMVGIAEEEDDWKEKETHACIARMPVDDSSSITMQRRIEAGARSGYEHATTII